MDRLGEVIAAFRFRITSCGITARIAYKPGFNAAFISALSLPVN